MWCNQQSIPITPLENHFLPPQKARRLSYLVAKTLRGNDCDLIADSLVGLEVEGQLGVVTLNNDLGGLLDGLGTNATHDCGGGRGLSGCRRS